MTKIPHLADTLQSALTDTPDRLARASGFLQRRRKITAATFVQALVFGWLQDPDASLDRLARSAAAVGCPIAPQSLDARFTEEAAVLLEGVLARAMGALLSGRSVPEGLLARFNGVHLLDTTTVALPAVVAKRWPGCGGNTPQAGEAALKVEVRLDLTDGHLAAHLMSGRAHDQSGVLPAEVLPEGALRVADLGYFSLETFARIAEQKAFWLSRFKVQTVLSDGEGRRLDLLELLGEADGRVVEVPVHLGAEHRVPCRLIARAVSEPVAAERRRRLDQRASGVDLLEVPVPAGLLERLLEQVYLLAPRHLPGGQVAVAGAVRRVVVVEGEAQELHARLLQRADAGADLADVVLPLLGRESEPGVFRVPEFDVEMHDAGV